MTEINDQNFVKYLRRKNERALDYVIDHYGGLVKSIVMKHLYGFLEYQEECINDIFLAVWQNADRFDQSKNSFKNWIAAISKYKCVDYKRKYYKYRSEQALDEQLSSPQDSMLQLEREELQQEIMQMISCLAKRDQEIFLDYFIEEMKTEEIAQKYQMRPSAVYNHISRGKKKIRSVYQVKRWGE